MTLIEMRLREVVDNELLVVQTDGKAFKGKLVEFDNNFLLMHECLETSTKEVKWKSVMVPLPAPKEQPMRTEEGAITYGEKEKKVAMLKKVMINLEHVMRIWLWDPEEYSPKEFDGQALITF